MEHAPSHSTAILSGGTPEHAPVINAAEKAFQRVFKKGYKPDDLFNVKEFTDLVTETKAAFDPAINFVQSDVLKSYLDQDAFIFSGLKTNRQLTQARSLLKDGKGNIRPYHQFEQEITKLNNTYNKLYLEAEYEFAVQSAQSADQWSNLSDDTERYWLQYRTAQDERVREDHAALAGTTLPKDDPFWDSYYPPNGWRCRCVAVEVLARKNKRSDSKEAIKKGEKATTQINKSGTNKLAMFRFNPGKQQKLFPPKNSYMPRGCGGKNLSLVQTHGRASQLTYAAFLALDDEACRAKKVIEENLNRLEYESLSKQQWIKEYFDTKTNGYVAIDKRRIPPAKKSHEVSKFNKEKAMCIVAANNGKRVKMLNEVSGVSSSDILFDNIRVDLKQTGSHNNILKYAKHGIKEQGSHAVLFEFTKRTDKIEAKILELKRKRFPFYYFYTDEKVIY